MKCMVRMVITTDESNEETREIANLEREDLTPNTEDLEVRMVPEMGWAGIKNEALLQMSEEHFDVLHTSDRNLVFQQNMSIVHLDILSDACTEQ